MVDIKRRRIFRLGAALAAGAAAPLLWSPPSEAGKVPKSALGYRNHPYHDFFCAKCVYFEPGPSPTAMGACALVAGSISPHGYCRAFVPKD